MRPRGPLPFPFPCFLSLHSFARCPLFPQAQHGPLDRFCGGSAVGGSPDWGQLIIAWPGWPHLGHIITLASARMATWIGARCSSLTTCLIMSARLDPGGSDRRISLVFRLDCCRKQSATTEPFASGGRVEESTAAWRRSTNCVKLSLSFCFIVDHGDGLAITLEVVRIASLAARVVAITSWARRPWACAWGVIIVGSVPINRCRLEPCSG